METTNPNEEITEQLEEVDEVVEVGQLNRIAAGENMESIGQTDKPAPLPGPGEVIHTFGDLLKESSDKPKEENPFDAELEKLKEEEAALLRKLSESSFTLEQIKGLWTKYKTSHMWRALSAGKWTYHFEAPDMSEGYTRIEMMPVAQNFSFPKFLEVFYIKQRA